jgi:hypothetical protein
MQEQKKCREEERCNSLFRFERRWRRVCNEYPREKFSNDSFIPSAWHDFPQCIISYSDAPEQLEGAVTLAISGTIRWISKWKFNVCWRWILFWNWPEIASVNALFCYLIVTGQIGMNMGRMISRNSGKRVDCLRGIGRIWMLGGKMSYDCKREEFGKIKMWYKIRYVIKKEMKYYQRKIYYGNKYNVKKIQII